MKTISGHWNEAPGAVSLIDAHHHLWDLKANRYPFLSDQPEPHFFLGAYDALRRDYLPEDYLRDSQAHNVLTTVHCEAEMDRSRQVAETEWLTGVNARYGFPGAIVAHAWFHTDNADEILAAQAQFPLVRGIRSKPVTSPRPDAVTPGVPGTMQDDRWLRGFALLQKYRLSWDLRVPYWHLSEAAEVARQFPSIPIVLNGVRPEGQRLGLQVEPACSPGGDRDLRHRAMHLRQQLSRRWPADRLRHARPLARPHARGPFPG